MPDPRILSDEFIARIRRSAAEHPVTDFEAKSLLDHIAALSEWQQQIDRLLSSRHAKTTVPTLEGSELPDNSIPELIAEPDDLMSDDYFEYQGENNCWDCGGRGWKITCIDDMCHGQDECIHGDPPTPCRTCNPKGDRFDDF